MARPQRAVASESASDPGPGVRPDRTLVLVLACFGLSGFAALLYETAWTREFAFVFGTSELAVATVLAAYMGGLAAGAAATARLAGRVRRPVLVYGLLELGIGAAALAVPWALERATGLHVALFGGRAAPPEAGGLLTALFYLAASFLILLVPTALMGATLPLLARHAVRHEREIGPRVGLLYAVNTLGAVAGTVCAAFVLLPAVGLRHTVLVGVGVNGLVFVVAALLATTAPPVLGPAERRASTPAAPSRRQLILPLVLASGACSFAYEVLWTRLLGHVLGGSVYAFATMLGSFLAGIALGSMAASRLATGPGRAARAFAVAQVGIAALSLLAFLGVGALPELARALGAGGAGQMLANAAVAALVLLPSALCMGATFPLAVRVLARSELEAGPASARVYAWNTVGAILGSVGAGFFLLPALGYAATATAAATLNLVLALLVPLAVEPAARRLAWAPAFGLLLLAWVRPDTPWAVLRHSALTGTANQGTVEFYGVGRSATVLLLDEGLHWRLFSNGLPEALVRRPGHEFERELTTGWLTALPVLARPELRSMLVVGLGGGVALERVPRGVEAIEVVELETKVVEANRTLAERRARDPLSESRVRIHLNDARSSLQLTRRRFDAIVSQPSHPWTAGASHLYTREFFRQIGERLTPSGVFVQWIGLHFVDEALLRSLVATLADVFPYVRVYRPQPVTVLFLASREPLPVEETAIRAIRAAPEDFAFVSLYSTEDVAMRLVLDEAAVHRFSAGAPVITDDANLLQMRSPRVLSDALAESGSADELLAPHEPLHERIPFLDGAYLLRRLADTSPARAREIAQVVADPALRSLGRGFVAARGGRPDVAALRFAEALRLDPGSETARFALVSAQREALLRGDPELEAQALELRDPAAAVVEGWRREAAGDFETLRALEDRLAGVGPRHVAHRAAMRLRVAWRLATGSPERAAEAVEILRRFVPFAGNADDLLLAARACVAAGESSAALAALDVLADRLPGERDRRRLARESRDLLERGSDDEALAPVRTAVGAKLDAIR